MRIDREAFLLAVSALAGCERADATTDGLRPPAFAPATQVEAQRFPASSMLTREAYEPPAPPEPVAPRRPLSMAKRWFFGLSMEERHNVSALCQEGMVHPCAPVGSMLRGTKSAQVADPEDSNVKYVRSMSTAQLQQATAYCTEIGPHVAPHCETPLVAAFDRQPVEFVAASRDVFAFVPGTAMATDWPTAATPWIAIDRDGDGAITSGAELFGSSTALAGGGTARHGFEALSALDANGDGVIDARDPAFAQLVLWADRNSDRRSTPDELRPLATIVTAIPLAHTVDPRCNARGACEGERGALRWRDATGADHEGAVIDVYVPRR